MGIVTLPCDVGRHRAVSFDVIEVDSDRVFLVDLCADWNGYASVIDAAQDVFHYCNATYGTRRLICDDARLGWQEITRENGAMSNEPYPESVPFKVTAKLFIARGQRNLHVGGAW